MGKIKMRVDGNNIRINEVKRLCRHGCRFVITEFVINKQNNFMVEQVSDFDEIQIGVYFNMRGAYRGIERHCNKSILDAVRHIRYSTRLQRKEVE